MLTPNQCQRRGDARDVSGEDTIRRSEVLMIHRDDFAKVWHEMDKQTAAAAPSVSESAMKLVSRTSERDQQLIARCRGRS